MSLAYGSELAAQCGTRRVRRLLVEELIDGRAAPGAVDEVVAGLNPPGFHDLRIAFVDATEDAATLVGAEIRAQQAGLVGRVFRRVDEAERWLLADLQPLRDARPSAV